MIIRINATDKILDIVLPSSLEFAQNEISLGIKDPRLTVCYYQTISSTIKIFNRIEYLHSFAIKFPKINSGMISSMILII